MAKSQDIAPVSAFGRQGSLFCFLLFYFLSLMPPPPSGWLDAVKIANEGIVRKEASHRVSLGAGVGFFVGDVPFMTNTTKVTLFFFYFP